MVGGRERDCAYRRILPSRPCERWPGAVNELLVPNHRCRHPAAGGDGRCDVSRPHASPLAEGELLGVTLAAQSSP